MGHKVPSSDFDRQNVLDSDADSILLNFVQNGCNRTISILVLVLLLINYYSKAKMPLFIQNKNLLEHSRHDLSKLKKKTRTFQKLIKEVTKYDIMIQKKQEPSRN